MNIKEIRIDNFGKLSGVQIELRQGINLVYAPNEGGKSTLHAFIRGMFFGMPRMRGRAARTDSYSRYEPWENPSSYGGRIRLECGGKQFRLSRNFSKEYGRTELVCETDGEQLSVEDGDLDMLLGNISEIIYDNTVSIGQLKGMTDQGLLLELRNYISGCQEGMDAGLNLKKAKDQLKDQRKKFQRKADQEAAQREERCRRLEERILEHQAKQESLQREWAARASSTPPVREEERTRENSGKKIYGIIFLIWMVLLAAGWFLSFPLWKILLIFLLGLLIAGWMIVRSAWSLNSAQVQREHLERKVQAEKERWQSESLRERIQEEEILLENLKSEYEQLSEQSVKNQSLQVEIQALELADQTIERLSGQMQKTIGRKLQERISGIFCELTGGKYRQVELDENMNLKMHTQERCIPAEKLSRGTLEQIYFAFRMAAGEILCQEEPLPVILDEAFVLYDDRRLAQTLEWLSKSGHQVILCTCHGRESVLMRKLGILFHEIELTK